MGWATAVVALAVSAASAAEGTGDKVLLKQKFTPGVWLMTTSMKLDQAVTIDGTPQPARQLVQTFVWSLDIGQPDKDGVKTIQIALKQAKQSVARGAETASYDSTGPAEKQEPQFARSLGPVLKAKIKATVGADGKVASVTGLNEIWDALAKDTPDAATFATQMKAQMGDSNIKDLLGKPAEMLPEKAVGVGDEWPPTLKFVMPAGAESEVKQTCKLQEVQTATAGKVAVIQYEGSGKITKETSVPMGPVTGKIQNMLSVQKGTVKFNVDLGLVDSLAVTQEGTTTFTVPGPEGKTQNIVTKDSSKSDISVVKGEAAPAAK